MVRPVLTVRLVRYHRHLLSVPADRWLRYPWRRRVPWDLARLSGPERLSRRLLLVPWDRSGLAVRWVLTVRCLQIQWAQLVLWCQVRLDRPWVQKALGDR